MPAKRSPRRAATDDVLAGGRELSTAMVLFHSILAGKQGLNATDTKALDLLARGGPLTAVELRERSGLAAPSITGLIDRLEKKGYVRRVADPDDRRRVRVELVLEKLGEGLHLFADLVAQMEDLCATFTVQELQSIARFLHEAAQRQHAAAIKLGASD